MITAARAEARYETLEALLKKGVKNLMGHQLDPDIISTYFEMHNYEVVSYARNRKKIYFISNKNKRLKLVLDQHNTVEEVEVLPNLEIDERADFYWNVVYKMLVEQKEKITKEGLQPVKRWWDQNKGWMEAIMPAENDFRLEVEVEPGSFMRDTDNGRLIEDEIETLIKRSASLLNKDKYESIRKKDWFTSPRDAYFAGKFLIEILGKTSAEEIITNRLKRERKGLQPGTKLTKFIRKTAGDSRYLTHFQPSVRDTAIEFIIEIYGQLLNRVKSKNCRLVLSFNPLDFLTMADYTTNWTSCHSFRENEYDTAWMSLAMDPMTAIAYTYDKTVKVHGTAVPIKEWRCLFYMHRGPKPVLVFAQEYPGKNVDYYRAMVETAQEAFGSYIGKPFKYSVDLTLSKLSGGWHFQDVAQKALSTEKGVKIKGLMPGHNFVFCLSCGKMITELEELAEDQPICFQCNGEQECELCGDIQHRSLMTYVDGENMNVCSVCLGHFDICEQCQGYVKPEELCDYYVEEKNSVCNICNSCAETFNICERCLALTKKELHERDGKMLCGYCALNVGMKALTNTAQ